MGPVGSILKASPWRGPERIKGGLGLWERGHPGSQVIWGTHGGGTYAHWVSDKGAVSPGPASCPWKGLLGKLPDIFCLEGSNLGGYD